MAQDAQGTAGTDELPEIPGYRLDSLLGTGGMGRVYLGTSPSGRQVAVKVIRTDLVHQPDFRRRFRREVTAARQVSGAFTAPVLDADPDADPPWMATLYVAGRPLDQRIKQGPELSAEELYRLATGLAEALRDIHRAGIVHRDLKPANVLLADDGPRVIDFGIVRAADADMPTGTGVTVGTPPFMSPEQIRAQKDVGPPSDIFSLGSVLTYAASGHVPFDATDVYTVAYQLVHEPPDLEGVPDWLLPVIEACLAKEQTERPDADGLLTLLQRTAYPAVLDSPDTVVLRPSAPPRPPATPVTEGAGSAPTPPTTPPRRRRRLVLSVAAAVVAVATLTGGLLYGLRGAEEGAGTSRSGGSGSGGPGSGGLGSGGSGGTAGPSARAVAQPEGSADYRSTQSGSGGFTFTYRDSPDRRPDGWRQWQYNLQNSDCVYAESSLVCVGDRTVRIDAATGTELWRTDKASSYGKNTPAVVDGVAVVNVGDRLVGLSLADGKVKWRYPTPTLTQRLIADGERAYAVDHDGGVYAVDARSGKERWTLRARVSQGGGTGHPPALRVVNGRLYVFTGVSEAESEENHVTVVDTGSGRRVSDYALSGACLPGSEALLEEDGAVWLYCAEPDETGTKNGILRQELAAGAEGVRTEVEAALGNGQIGAPELSVTPGRVLFVAPTETGGELVAVDPVRRTELWRRTLPGRGPADAPPVQAGDRVYVANLRGVAVYGARTGKLVYQHSVPDIKDDSGIELGLDTEPMVAGGVIYAPSSKAGWVSLDTGDTGDTGSGGDG
ncbi:PQQ-binding-like beta-propeller repeat protein [Streptomyces phyllanthi]|uniref:PQQ-binding-like beta-propeller repeat protein n=1 Tax=Streptomyces phyllanthi TaxID=1803180 RepID=A0A5N8W978_9ACTN|nr:serine/threonine-protein kinase [Streptomyces phyllanthi]MPY44021.1 PQQ-binding-like beta-propeller repeat protein [Streptomyces phyllanthi]